MDEKKASAKISVVMEFTETGYLKAILLNAESEKNQVTLERALDRLLNPQHFGWIRRLFKRGFK
jgi:hypothetical protein